MAEKKKTGRKPKAKVEEPVVGVAEVEPKAEQNSEIEALKSLVKQLQDQLAAQKPHVVQVMADTEKVVLRFQAEVADDNVATFGPEGMYGQVTGKTGTITVPKSEWSRFYNESVRNMIYRRWLIVLSGMDEQRAGAEDQRVELAPLHEPREGRDPTAQQLRQREGGLHYAEEEHDLPRAPVPHGLKPAEEHHDGQHFAGGHHKLGDHLHQQARTVLQRGLEQHPHRVKHVFHRPQPPCTIMLFRRFCHIARPMARKMRIHPTCTAMLRAPSGRVAHCWYMRMGASSAWAKG